MTVDTILKDSFIVHFHNEEYPDLQAKVIWGIVLDDPSGRWQPDDFVCSSQIISEEDGIFSTQNSTYKAVGEVKPIDLPLASLKQLRSGISPATCSALEQITQNKSTHLVK